MSVKCAFLFPGQGSQAVGMGQDFFEKSAVALYKEAAYPVLNDIRECLKMDRLTSDNIKTASASIVDDTTPELKKVSNMLRLRVEHREYDEAAIMLRRRLRGV